MIARLLTIVQSEKAEEVSDQGRGYNGTVHWREVWWRHIRDTVFENKKSVVLGLGYGYPLHLLNPDLKGEEVRTPHSILYFTFAYSGLIGMFTFGLLQSTMGLLLWRTYKENGKLVRPCNLGRYSGNLPVWELLGVTTVCYSSLHTHWLVYCSRLG